MKTPPRTRLAVLGTMSDLHTQPVAYDLASLRKIVTDLSPDLLCAEITQEAWEGGDLGRASPEVREALAPAVAATDIVLIPVAPSPQRFEDFTSAAGWRRKIVRTFDRLLRWGQREAGDAEAINGPLFGVFCHTVCWLIEMAWTMDDRMAWEEQNERLAQSILRVAQHDPGRRVLVAVQCQRLHRLLPLLKAHADLLEIVGYQNL